MDAQLLENVALSARPFLADVGLDFQDLRNAELLAAWMNNAVYSVAHAKRHATSYQNLINLVYTSARSDGAQGILEVDWNLDLGRRLSASVVLISVVRHDVTLVAVLRVPILLVAVVLVSVIVGAMLLDAVLLDSALLVTLLLIEDVLLVDDVALVARSMESSTRFRRPNFCLFLCCITSLSFGLTLIVRLLLNCICVRNEGLRCGTGRLTGIWLRMLAEWDAGRPSLPIGPIVSTHHIEQVPSLLVEVVGVSIVKGIGVCHAEEIGVYLRLRYTVSSILV